MTASAVTSITVVSYSIEPAHESDLSRPPSKKTKMHRLYSVGFRADRPDLQGNWAGSVKSSAKTTGDAFEIWMAGRRGGRDLRSFPPRVQSVSVAA